MPAANRPQARKRCAHHGEHDADQLAGDSVAEPLREAR